MNLPVFILMVVSVMVFFIVMEWNLRPHIISAINRILCIIGWHNWRKECVSRIEDRGGISVERAHVRVYCTECGRVAR